MRVYTGYHSVGSQPAELLIYTRPLSYIQSVSFTLVLPQVFFFKYLFQVIFNTYLMMEMLFIKKKNITVPWGNKYAVKCYPFSLFAYAYAQNLSRKYIKYPTTRISLVIFTM